MAIQSVKISDVKSNPNNPRLIKNDKFEKLVQSLKDFPEMAKVRPIVVNQDFVVLGGNMRLKAMKEAGWKEVPIQVVDWSEQQQKEFIIKDNVGFGEWEWDMLANEWEAEDLDKWGLDVPKFEEQEDPFDDAGVEGKSQYGVIVMCASEGEQEHIFIRLTGEGFNCKIVVT